MKDALETTRRFLVPREALPDFEDGEEVAEAYLGLDPIVRVCVRAGCGVLTVRGTGLHRHRMVEIEIAAEEARTLMDLRLPGSRVIEKVLHRVPFGGRTWDVHVFEGHLEGLALAEVELSSAGRVFELPAWIGSEVTEDPRYQDVSLARSRPPPPAAGPA